MHLLSGPGWARHGEGGLSGWWINTCWKRIDIILLDSRNAMYIFFQTQPAACNVMYNGREEMWFEEPGNFYQYPEYRIALAPCAPMEKEGMEMKPEWIRGWEEMRGICVREACLRLVCVVMRLYIVVYASPCKL